MSVSEDGILRLRAERRIDRATFEMAMLGDVEAMAQCRRAIEVRDRRVFVEDATP